MNLLSMADLEAEKAALFTQSTPSQMAHTKPGVTREQGERMCARTSAWIRAHNFSYNNGETYAQTVDRAIEDGLTVFHKSTASVTLSNADGTRTLRFKQREAMSYIQTVLNVGSFAKNY